MNVFIKHDVLEFNYDFFILLMLKELIEMLVDLVFRFSYRDMYVSKQK